jgi:UPF0755 protein
MSRLFVPVVSGVLVLLLVLVFGVTWSLRQLNAPLEIPDEGMFYEVSRGAALSTVTGQLQQAGVLHHAWVVDWYARLSGAETGIRAGEYLLVPGLTSVSLLEKFRAGDVYLHQFTIVEGWRFEEMLTRLRAHPARVSGPDSGAEIMTALGMPEDHPEGQFLPDTYSFPRGTADRELLEWAHAALQSVVEQAWAERPDGSILEEPYAGLILASIIEKETALDSERGIVSGVFHARLRRGMRLQTDPTVIYGLGAEFNGDITRADLARDTPYNTYTRNGLPPTPIALPGRASILAAFSPVESGALYFVATGEPDGSHYFSSNLEEHNAAVSRYLARQQAGE